MTERATIHSTTPNKTAVAFQVRLALEKGFTSDLVINGKDVIVVASDGQAVRFAPMRTYTKAERNRVAAASDGGPDLGTWLARIRAMNDPALTEAVDGIWCGRSGDQRFDVTGAKAMLCVGWHNGRVEWSYLS